MSFLPVIRWSLMFLWISGLFLAAGGCASQRLQGKWVLDKDEDEFAGRYVYAFRESGEIDLFEYPDKEAEKCVRTGRIGSYSLSGRTISINWRDGKVPNQRYRVNYGTGRMLLEDLQATNNVLRFIKTKQCD